MQLNFISNPYCAKCGTPFEFEIKNKLFCGKCLINPPQYALARALLKFDFQSKKLIHNFKYNDSTISARLFAKLLVVRYQADLSDIDIIVPVPMYRLKRIFRHYNPAQILAIELGKRLNMPVIQDLLIKIKWTKAQTKLSKKERETNLRGSIICNTRYNLSGKTILLVDDMRTTGATTDHCIKELKKRDAEQIKLVTIGIT
ncbi:MAG: ComF family protein [Rickettsiaceae bacterium]|nr:ComF family protein [Rickettsiaceae bacterium]